MRVLVEDGLGARAREWDDLVARQPLPSPFLLSWWVDLAAEGRPVVLHCVDATDGSLVGGAALQLDRIGRGPASLERVRCLGQGELAPDHLDVVAVPGREQEVCRRVIGWLRRPGARVVDLDGLAATGRLAGALASSEIDRTGAPWTPLPADPADYLADRPGTLRSTISRSRKRFDKVGASVRRVPAEEADRALDTLASLHDDRWADESGFLAAWDRFRAAAHDGIASGAVVIHELRAANGRVVATELDLVSGDRLAFYQAGRDTDRDWRGSGSVLKAAIIDWACSERLVEFDLLRGDEPYKADWARERRELVRVRFGVGPAGRSVVAGAAAWRRARPALDRIRDRVSPAPSAPVP